ncbi:MAG: alpha/beta hydrolase [Erysipelotrichaceae bacterium]|nr:alpha/beta hydrolase [Erysipelotrichaceae bacterium]
MLTHDKPGQKHDYVAERKRNDVEPPRPPKGVKLEEFDLNGFLADRITKEGNDKGIIFYIHGGGFTTGAAKERRIITYYVADHYGYNCISINYRLAPENKWPAHIEDCFTAYDNVLKMGYDPDKIILIGESAGGSLVLSLGLLIKQRGLRQPRAIVAFSPCADQFSDLPSHTMNIPTDHMLRDAVSKGLTSTLFDHEPTAEDLKDPLVSPYYGNYEGLPPVFLSASDTETLFDDSVLLYQILQREGHNVMFVKEHGLCHAYQIMTYMPEARKTLDKVFGFLERI